MKNLHLTHHDLPYDLGDELVLRFATPADAETLAQFNGRIHADEHPDHFDPMVAAWTRDLCSEQHPTIGPSNITLVENTLAGKIVSSMCLIPQTWTYAGISFEVGQPEAVGTDPDYRRRGLVRMQFEVLHAKSAAMGHFVQVITGIPWYYRQFGYEYALDLDGGRMTHLGNISPLKDGEAEPYRLRPMTPLTLKDDLPLVKALYERDCARSLIACLHPDWMWEALFTWYSPDSPAAKHFQIIETAEGHAVGYLAPNREIWDGQFLIDELVVVEGQSLRAVMPSVQRALKPIAEAEAAKQNKMVTVLFYRLNREHPVFEVAPELFQKTRPPDAWYIRVADVPGFLKRIVPALEARLAHSPLAGHAGELKVSEYQTGFRLVFEQGKIVTVEAWKPADAEEGHAAFPPLVFLQLLFGFHSLAELRSFYADCWAKDEAAALLNVLFPKSNSCVILLG